MSLPSLTAEQRDCGCVIHPGETHSEHMRLLYIRMAREETARIAEGVADVVAKAKAGELVTQHEAYAVQHAALAVAAIYRDLILSLDDVAAQDAADIRAALTDSEGADRG